MNHNQTEELLHLLHGTLRAYVDLGRQLEKLNDHLAAKEVRKRMKAERKAEKRARKANKS
jgi:hypothetical protein